MEEPFFPPLDCSASVTTYNYDGNRNLIEVVDAEDNGGTGSSISGAGDMTRYYYDGYDRRKKVVDPLGNVTWYTYDANGHVIRIVQEGDADNDVDGTGGNATLAVTEYIYDEMDRRTTTHQVLFRTQQQMWNYSTSANSLASGRTVPLTDTSEMDALAQQYWHWNSTNEEFEVVSGSSYDTESVHGFTDDVDVIGRVTTITEYDKKGRVTFQVTDDLDVTRTYYDGADRVIKTKDSAISNDWHSTAFYPYLDGNTVEMAYDDNGNVIETLQTDVSDVSSVADETFRTTNFYDALDRLTLTVDNLGEATFMHYDSRGNLVARADANGPTEAEDIVSNGDFENSSTGWTLGSGWTYMAMEGDDHGVMVSYNAEGTLSQAVSNLVPGVMYSVVLETELITNGGSLIVGLGSAAPYETICNDLGSGYYEYILLAGTDEDHLLEIGLDEWGSGASSYEVDNISVTPLNGCADINRRGLNSSASVEINGHGNVTRTYYDGLSRVVESETLLNVTGKGVYIAADIYGVKSDSDAFCDSDQGGGDGRISAYYAYDDNSQLVGLRDDNGNVTAYIYDNQGRQLVERKGLYASGGALVVSGGDSVEFNVSLRGGVTPVDTEGSGTDITLTYDMDGNVETRTDEAGNVFEYVSDALNRRKEIEVTTQATGFIGSTLQTFEYDGIGRMTYASDNNASGTDDDVACTFAYDSLSRLVEESQQLGSLSAKYTTSYFEASCGTLTQESSCVYPDGRVVENEYDGLDRLVSRNDDGYSDIGAYDYIGRGRVLTLTFQNDTRLTHLNGSTDAGFDAMQRIKNHRWESFTTETPGNGTLIVGFEHQDSSGNSLYDRVGNKLIEYKTHDAENSEMYQYDSAYRLTSIGAGTQSAGSRGFEHGTFSDGGRDSMSTVNYYEDWDLDGLGNWPSVWKDSSTAQTRTHSDFNEIVNNNGTTLTHDANGNLTNDGTRLLKWDAFGRLREVWDDTGTTQWAEYTYDAFNCRMSKVVTNDGINSNSDLNGDTHYYYHGWRVLEEHSYDASEQLERQFTYGNYLDEVWTLDARYDGDGAITVSALNDGSGAQRLFLCSNTLYSVFAATDETGALVERYQYDPYGARTIYDSSSTVISSTAYGINHAFTGQRHDSETELMYYKYRYYSPYLGRFISRDKIEYEPTLNLYHYVMSSVVGWLDPYGLFPKIKYDPYEDWDKQYDDLLEEQYRRQSKRNRDLRKPEEFKKKLEDHSLDGANKSKQRSEHQRQYGKEIGGAILVGLALGTAANATIESYTALYKAEVMEYNQQFANQDWTFCNEKCQNLVSSYKKTPFYSAYKNDCDLLYIIENPNKKEEPDPPYIGIPIVPPLPSEIYIGCMEKCMENCNY